MTSVSNNVAAVIHVVGSYIVSMLIGSILAGLIFSSGIGFGGVINVTLIFSLIFTAIAVYVSGLVIKKFFSYPDKIQVVKLSTLISLALSVLVSLTTLFVMPIYVIVRVVLGTAIFYFVSQKAL